MLHLHLSCFPCLLPSWRRSPPVSRLWPCPLSPPQRLFLSLTFTWHPPLTFSHEHIKPSQGWPTEGKGKSLSRVWLLATPWTAAYQAPPSMGFSRTNQKPNTKPSGLQDRLPFGLLLHSCLLPGPNFLEEQGEFAASIYSALPPP